MFIQYFNNGDRKDIREMKCVGIKPQMHGEERKLRVVRQTWQKYCETTIDWNDVIRIKSFSRAIPFDFHGWAVYPMKSIDDFASAYPLKDIVSMISPDFDFNHKAFWVDPKTEKLVSMNELPSHTYLEENGYFDF